MVKLEERLLHILSSFVRKKCYGRSSFVANPLLTVDMDRLELGVLGQKAGAGDHAPAEYARNLAFDVWY